MTILSDRFHEIYSELKTQGYTQTKLAEALGLTQATVSDYLRGNSMISVPVAQLIEIKFGYRKDWLLGGELPKKVDNDEKQKAISKDVEFTRAILRDPELKGIIENILNLKKTEKERLFAVIRGFLGI